MERKDQLDAFGTIALILFALFLALNQVVIKVGNEGLQPVFFAGIRSLGGAFCVWLWIRFRGRRLDFPKGTSKYGVLIGVIFSFEFLCLFTALDLTSVTRVSIIFYSMPVWLSLMAHFVLPGDRIHPLKAIGLLIAFLGVAIAIIARGSGAGGQASLLGDIAALGAAFGWAGTAIVVRISPLAKIRPEMQNFWQLLVSAPILLVMSLFFGDLIRDFQPIHFWTLAFQIVLVVSAGFMFWLWLLSIYPASGVASFSFLSPIFGIFLGWLLLGEQVGTTVLIAGAMVALGLLLINRPRPVAQ